MYWLFQSVPKRYNLADRMQQGQTETWLVTRFMDEMRRGDLVFLWMAGPPEIRGLYGWGRVSSEAPSYYKDWGYGVDVIYERKFPHHIPFSEIKSLPSFSDYVLFKTAIGTNFRLSESQAIALGELISSVFGPQAAP